MREEKLQFDARQTQEELGVLASKQQKIHATIDKQNEKIRPKQSSLLDYMSSTWNEMLNTSNGNKNYF